VQGYVNDDDDDVVRSRFWIGLEPFEGTNALTGSQPSMAADVAEAVSFCSCISGWPEVRQADASRLGCSNRMHSYY